MQVALPRRYGQRVGELFGRLPILHGVQDNGSVFLLAKLGELALAALYYLVDCFGV